MCRDTNGSTELDNWLKIHVSGSPSYPSDAEIHHFVAVCRRAKTGKASGLDGWTPAMIRAIGRAQAMAILTFLNWCECYAQWPSSMQLLRTHLIPKVEDVIPQPQELRPIALLSCWFRVWSAWRLENSCVQVCQDLDLDLIGGIPTRDSGDQMAALMMRIERILDQGRNAAEAMGVISLDASKCFDRIHQAQALEYGRLAGIPVPVLRGLGGLMLDVRRHFSSAGYLDLEPVQPQTALCKGTRCRFVMQSDCSKLDAALQAGGC